MTKMKRTFRPFAVILCLTLALCTCAVPALAVEQVNIEDTTEQPEKQVLRFVQPRYGSSFVDDLFLQLHPEVSLEYLDWDPEDTSFQAPHNNPIQEFRCDDPTTPIIDIYILSVTEGLHRLIREGYVLDLSGSESISAAHATYLPQVQEVLSVDGKPIAIPIHFNVAGWDYDKNAWEAFGMPNVPKTADELIQLVSRWNQDIILPPETALYGPEEFYSRRARLIMDITNMYVIQYATSDAALDFDTPEFKDMVNRIVNLPEIPEDFSRSTPLLRCGINNYPRTFSLLDLERGDMFNPDITPVLPMSFSESGVAKVGAEIAVMCIASNTQNRELAMEYVELVLGHQGEQQKDLRAMLTLDVQEMDALGLSKETQDFYRNLAPGITFNSGALGGFWPTAWQGEYFWFVFLDAYDLPDDAYGREFWDHLFGLMREDISPFIAKLNEEAQHLFAARH